jgi:cytochrome c551/c552
MKNWVTLLCLITLVVPVSAVWAQTESSGDNCLECHREMSPGLYLQWNGTKHAENGISCIDCHEADPADVDAFEHHGSNVATLVTPKDCGACHTDEAEQVGNSYHATAGQILESADAYLAHVAAGEPIAIVGCVSCHGARVRIDESSPNKLSAKTWPNSGIRTGRSVPATPATLVTISRPRKPVSPKPAVNATSDRIIRRWRCMRNRNTEMSTIRTSTR